MLLQAELVHSVLDERDAVGLQAKCRRAPLPRGSECGTAALAGRLDLLRAASESEELPAVLLADLKRDATVVLEVVAAWDHMFLSEGVSTLAVVLGSAVFGLDGGRDPQDGACAAWQTYFY